MTNISSAAAILGRKGGSVTSEAKAAAARLNGAIPRPKSKRKGWPKGKPRGPKP